MTFTEALGWTLVHFLWQGAAVAVLLALANLGLRRATANARYLAACAAMVAMLAAAVGTFVWLVTEPRAAPAMARAAPLGASPAAAAPPAPAARSIPDVFPWMIGLWATGVALLSVWSAGGWVLAQRMKWRSRQIAAVVWQEMLARLAARLRIRRAVRLCESVLVRVPTVIGWLRPVILLPASVVARLSPREVEALLAHELAHIRRHDYLVNLVQTAVETLFYYQPAVWWVSRRIRAERENCCDDLAVSACGDALVYARALTDLEELREPAFALAASGGSLTSRVRRLVGNERAGASWPVGWLGVLVLGLATAWAVDSRREAAPAAQIQPSGGREGFLAGLLAAGYEGLTVDEIISLKNNGVTPDYMKKMRLAGLGKPAPSELIRLRQHGVAPEYTQAAAAAGFADLNFERLVRLRQHGVRTERFREIHSLGFGPFTVEQAVNLHNHGVKPDVFHAFKEAGIARISPEQAVQAARHGLSSAAVREAHRQGFTNLTVEQLIRLKRGGVI